MWFRQCYRTDNVRINPESKQAVSYCIESIYSQFRAFLNTRSDTFQQCLRLALVCGLRSACFFLSLANRLLTFYLQGHYRLCRSQRTLPRTDRIRISRAGRFGANAQEAMSEVTHLSSHFTSCCGLWFRDWQAFFFWGPAESVGDAAAFAFSVGRVEAGEEHAAEF